MADTKVKPTRKKTFIVKTSPKIKKIKVSNKPSAAEVDDLINEEDGANSDETQCLLRTIFNIKKNCFAQEGEDLTDSQNIENLQPVDQLMSSDKYKKPFDYEQYANVVLEEEQDYVIIGCYLPDGVVITVGRKKFLLRGSNDMPSHYKKVGFTKVIKSVWNAFLKTHKNWSPLLKGSVFVVNGKNQ